MNIDLDLETPTGRDWARRIAESRKAGEAPKRAPAHVTGRMNKTEAAFARRLEGMKAAGEVSAYWHERFKLRLADGCHYTPDFLVLFADGRFVFCETKGGFVREDSVVKWKLAAEMFPQFGWEMWQRKGRGGEFTRIRTGGQP